LKNSEKDFGLQISISEINFNFLVNMFSSVIKIFSMFLFVILFCIQNLQTKFSLRPFSKCACEFYTEKLKRVENVM
jgi:hypothetical protein